MHFNRKFSSCFVALLAVFAACKKDDDTVFDQSPDERINATLTKYQTLLTGAPYGWKGVVQPAGGGAYSFYFKFNNENRVVMYSDFDSSTAVTPRESSYRLKALQQPSLLFDTYSYLHSLSDPNENTITVQSNINENRGGSLGLGLQSDFEFAIDTATSDSVRLTGRQHGAKAFLLKATQEEATAYANKQLAAPLLQLRNLRNILYYFKRLTLGGKVYDVSIDDNTKSITFTWVDGSGNTHTFSTPYYYTTSGIEFTTAFTDGSQTISGFTGIAWNAAANTLAVTADAATGTIAGAPSPIAVDKAAPARWWNAAASSGSFWVSENGFHVNGVDDAYGINSLTSGSWRYYILVYWPQYGANYDLLGPVFIDSTGNDPSLFYGTASQAPSISSDGRAVFKILGTLGPHPTSGPAALTQTQMGNTRGYYFVQTSASSYDMISAADSRIWITWIQ